MNIKVLKKTGLYFVGNFSSKFLMALIIPIYAFYITSEDLGYFDYAQTLMSILVPIIFVSVWDAVLKYFIDAKYNNKCIITNIIAVTAIGTVIMILLVWLYTHYFHTENSILFLLMFLVYGYAQIWQFFARGLVETNLYVQSGIISTIVNFVSILILVVGLKLGLLGLILSYIASQTVIIIIIETKLKLVRYFVFSQFNVHIIKEMLVFSAPLTLNTISSWLFNGFSRFIIMNRLGAFKSGLYAFSGKFAIVITMLGSVITMAVIEEAILNRKSISTDADKTNSNNEAKNAEDLYLLLVSISMIAMPCIKIFYLTLSNSEYFSSLIYVPILLFYAIMSTLSSIIGAQFHALEKTKYQFITTIIGSSVTVLISIALIGKYGVLVVALAQALGAFIMVISRYSFVNKYMQYRLDLIRMFFVTLGFAVVCFISVKTNAKINIAILIGSGLLCIYFNQKWISRVCKCFTISGL